MIVRANYLKVCKFLTYLREVLQLSDASVDRYRFYLRHLLIWADQNDFTTVEVIRPTFPKYLTTLPGKNGVSCLAPATQKKILEISKRFFHWAKTIYSQELNKLPIEWMDTLRLVRQPPSSKENVFVSEEEIRKLISFPVPAHDLALVRDQAAAAFLYLSGIRASAFVTLPISAIDIKNLTIYQWPELGVHTKNGKKATTFLFNIPVLLEAVNRWDLIVRKELESSAVWYAPINHIWGDQAISAMEPGKSRMQALGKRLRILFSKVELEYKSPHKFRHGNAVYGLLHAQTVADYKAVSMNLMHESIEITDSVYAPMLRSDVKTRIADLSERQENTNVSELESYINSLEKDKLRDVLMIIAGKLTN